ncbi:hypothetical protein CRENBAI_025070 [Crenichthys baileyi]|uniref:ABC transmembrane type-1 domain-containing protein n=1 Tax=Crenichthys baileyi TaxID=28760 RepID=A0AAV9QZ53_9TELE
MMDRSVRLLVFSLQVFLLVAAFSSPSAADFGSGFLLFGVSGYLAYREILRMSAAVLAIVRLPGMYDGIYRAISIQTKMLRELNRRLDVILAQDRRQIVVPGLRGEMG